MALREIFKTVTQTVSASVLSALKTFAGAGQALFGGKKILKHFSEDVGLPIPEVGKKIFLGVIIFGASNTNVLTRASTIFRKIFSPSNYLRILRITKAPNNVVVLEEVIIASPNPNPEFDDIDDDFENEDLEAADAPDPINTPILSGEPVFVPSPMRQAAHRGITTLVDVCSYSSSFFTSVNAYLGGENFLEYITNTDMEDQDKQPSDQLKLFIQIGAFFIALGNFYSNLTYNSSAARRNGERFANWATNIDGTYNHRLRDIWNYKWTLLITLPNVIVSEPAYAYFTTRFSLPTVPYITTVCSENTILKITAFSTGTAFVQNVFTNIPSTQELLQPTPDIKAALDRLPIKGQALLRYGRSVGFLDSGMTGLSYYVAIGDTISKVSNHTIPRMNPSVLAISALCGTIKIVTNQGFSVDPGVISLLRDIYPETFEEEKQKFQNSQRIQPAQQMVVEAKEDKSASNSIKKYSRIKHSQTAKLPLLTQTYIDSADDKLEKTELKSHDPFSQSTPNLNALVEPTSTALTMAKLNLDTPQSGSGKNTVNYINFDGEEEKRPVLKQEERKTALIIAHSEPLPKLKPLPRRTLYLPEDKRNVVIAASTVHRSTRLRRPHYNEAKRIDDRTSNIEASILHGGM